MIVEFPASQIEEVASKELPETILTVPFLMPSIRLLHRSSGSMNSSSKIVGLFIVLSNPSDRVNQAGSSSKSNKVFMGGNGTNAVASPSILKLFVTILIGIDKARSREQAFDTSSK